MTSDCRSWQSSPNISYPTQFALSPGEQVKTSLKRLLMISLCRLGVYPIILSFCVVFTGLCKPSIKLSMAG